ncbi:hypothetical protein [Tenacibaculum singaporense]|uniref:Uncharacterized protein n=1 Tax=Tenacibaculum singaporense TaxID=2358479 RepID=A0A3S8R8B5_9FLAO|nr:hypothetical protein [Tenacibaculum singaporense]AZJ35985.1 hypothetical protein D6T69_10805 [Tenacibaculum singaporense]
MSTINFLKSKLSKYYILDGAFASFCQKNTHRDFEVFIYSDFGEIKLKVTLKGVISVNYLSKVKQDDFIMDNEYIESAQPNPLNGFYWGIKSFIINNWEIKDSDPDLIELQKDYNFKLYKLVFSVNSCNISFIFHDLEIEEEKNN